MTVSNATLTITQHDGQTIDVTPNIGDTLAFESTLRKNKAWGGLTDNAMRMMFFRAWSAAKREQKTTQTWDEFSSGEQAAVDVSFKKDENDESTDDDAVVSLGESIPEGQPTSY
jgi:hypothetical protein